MPSVMGLDTDASSIELARQAGDDIDYVVENLVAGATSAGRPPVPTLTLPLHAHLGDTTLEKSLSPSPDGQPRNLHVTRWSRN